MNPGFPKMLLTRLWFLFGMPVLGFWLFDFFPVGPPRWLTEGPADDPAFRYLHLARNVWLCLLIVISTAPFMWIDSSRLRKRFLFADILPMGKMILASRRGATILFVILVSAILTGSVVSAGAQAPRSAAGRRSADQCGLQP